MSVQEADLVKLASIIKTLGGESTLVRPTTPLRDIGLDSLKTMELVLALEEAFDIQIPDEDLTEENLRTPETVLNLVGRLKK